MTEPPTARPPILAFCGVTRRYARQAEPAVDAVDLEVAHGEILALIGESGSGKTTLLRLAAGLEAPDAGQVLIEGECVAGGGLARPLPPEKRLFGLVSQDGALFPHLVARRNVAYGLTRMAAAAKAARVRECLEVVGLADKAERYPHELSGGERQRLALARALAPRPRRGLLDEPFSHLDPALRRHLREQIREILSRLRQTALLVTHDPEDALAIASRVAILERGQVAQTGTPREVYLRPASQYCAERFGPANRVVDPATGETAWTRPEDARWIACEIADEGQPVAVESVRELGHLWEVRVVTEDAPRERWLCFLKEGAYLKPGDRGRVAWRGAPETVVWKS